MTNANVEKEKKKKGGHQKNELIVMLLNPKPPFCIKKSDVAVG